MGIGLLGLPAELYGTMLIAILIKQRELRIGEEHGGKGGGDSEVEGCVCVDQVFALTC